SGGSRSGSLLEREEHPAWVTRISDLVFPRRSRGFELPGSFFDLHEDLAILFPDREGPDGKSGRHSQDTPVPDIKARPVARALDPVIEEPSLAQRAIVVRAEILHRVDLRAHLAKRNAEAIGFKNTSLPLGDLADLCQGNCLLYQRIPPRGSLSGPR